MSCALHTSLPCCFTSMHFAAMLCHAALLRAAMLLYFAAMLLYFAAMLLYFAAMLLYFAAMLLYFAAMLLYFAAMLLYFAAPHAALLRCHAALLRCHAALLEELLSEGYSYVLTSRFQSDPLEKRHGQYRQMSGGRFMVGLKDVVFSENILKIKSLVKEGLDIDDWVKVTDEKVAEFRDSVQPIIS